MRALTVVSLSTLLLTILACGGGDDAAPDDDAPPPPPELDEGEPVVPSPAPQPFGSGTLTATPCDLGGVSFTGEGTSSRLKSIDAAMGFVYVADGEGVLYRFIEKDGEGCSLELDTGFGDQGKMHFEKKIEWVSAGGDRVMASNGIFQTYVLTGGSLSFSCDATGYGELHDSGTWAIVPWVNSTVELAELGADACSKSDWALQNLSKDDARKGIFDSVNASAVVGDQIYIGGSLAKSVDSEGTRRIAVYNKAGKELRRFGGEGEGSADSRFGWVHALSGCGPGVCALDGNYRRLTAWSESGQLVAAVDLKKLLGLGYPWTNDFAVGGDGTGWMIAANDREKGDLADGFIYRIEGMGAGAGGSAAPAADPSKGKGKGSTRRFGLPKRGKRR